jgi:hypothetical protein
MSRFRHQTQRSESDTYWREKVCGDESWTAGLLLVAVALLAMSVA